MALWTAQCYKRSYDEWTVFWKLSSLCHIVKALNCHWFPIGFWCHRNAHEGSVLASVCHDGGKQRQWCYTWFLHRELRHREVGLFLFCCVDLLFFTAGQIFNKLFISVSGFYAFTIPMLSFNQQPSLAVTCSKSLRRSMGELGTEPFLSVTTVNAHL